jgi:glycosyltransferase involved in cell wall biosynthesis
MEGHSTENASGRLSVILLTYNEEANLPACLESLTGLNCEIFVVDSGSIDSTREIATQFGATVVKHSFEGHTKQWNWALQNLPILTGWVLGLDADQRLTPELAAELHRLFTLERVRLTQVDGFYINRRQVFRGKWIRHGGYYPKYLLKLFRRERVKTDLNDLVDHHFYVEGRVAKLRHDLIEENKRENDISFWIEKHNHYAALLASEEFLYRKNGRRKPIEPSLMGNPDQRTLWRKQLWYRFPLFVRPFLYFLYRYLVRLGFLDGKEGFIFHFLQAFWFRLLVDIKLEELEREGSNDRAYSPLQE